MNKFLIFTIILIITASCCSTNTIADAPNKPADFNNTIVIDDKISVSEGKLVTKTQPLSVSQTIPITPKTPVKVAVAPIITSPVIPKTEQTTTIVPVPSVTNSLSHSSFNALLQNNVSSAGNVNYEGFKKNRKALIAYITLLGDNVPQDNWTRNDKLAYWMNAYNAMTIDLILRNWPVASIKDIKSPWEQRFWKLGEKYYNLDEIEHKILRPMGDPRIHFGINCASFSCPPLLNEAFTADKVDAQLNRVSKKFINDASRNMITANSIEISKIFDWFSKDFKQNGSIINFLNNYSNVQISEDAKVRFMDYNWELNK